MKKIVLSIVLMCVAMCYAQITTPGNGVAYTFAKLATDFPTDVTVSPNGTATLNNNLTVSAKDTLVIDAGLQALEIKGAITITICGSVACEPRQGKLLISGQPADSTGTAFDWRFEQATPSTLSNIIFEKGDNIYIDKSNIIFDSCEFRLFNSQVIRYMNCNPTIQNCYFHDNRMAAINSAANVTGAPVIRNNILYHNVLDNLNQPQINLGPGTAEDTIFITGNVIDGCSTMSGGIAVADLMNVSTTNVVIRNNRIENNRYGYTQNGSNIFALIEDNILRNNNLETDPMNGGSGISIYGSDTTCAAKIRRNLITGNLWGITAIYYHNIDMGRAADFGYNSIYDNENGGTTYALYNNAYSPMNAIGNYWGDNSEEYAEDVIFHQSDQDNLGIVTYTPIWHLSPDLLACRATDTLKSITVEGIASDDLPYTYTLSYLAGSDETFNISDWTFQLDMPLGVEYELIDEDATEDGLTLSRVYRLTTPHGTSQDWTIIFDVATSVKDFSTPEIDIFPNPTTDKCHIISSDPISQITVMNQLGQVILNMSGTGNEETLSDLDRLPQGIYFVVVMAQNKKAIKKLEIK